MTIQISKAYRTGASWRCKIKDPAWRWLKESTAPTAEESLRLAQEHTASRERGSASDPPAEESGPTPRKRGETTGPRLAGLHEHYGGLRYGIIVSGERRWAPTGKTESEARRRAEQLLVTIAKQGSLAIRDSIGVLVEHKRQNGAAASTLEGTRRGLELFWAGMLDSPVSRVSERTAQAQYLKLRETAAEGTGKLLSVDTQRCYLKHAKLWGRFAVKRGWLRGPSPCEAVEAVGKRRYGKPQLSRRELLQLIDKCRELAGQGDLGAAAVLTAVCTGLRASEVLSREVKDLDREQDLDTGEDVPVLRICDNAERAFKLKTGESKRSVPVHPLLQSVLDGLATGKTPADPLFPGTHAGRRRRQWLWTEVGRITRLAGVSVVCAHALRGSLATGAAASGKIHVDLISAALGHADSKITRQHYIQRGTLERAQLERAQAALLRPQPAALPA